MRPLADQLGIANPHLFETAAALLVILLALALAWAAGRLIGPRLALIGERSARPQAEAIAPRLCALVRYAAAWPLLALALVAHDWQPLATLAIGLASAAAAALLVRAVARALQLPRWGAWLLFGVVFVAVLGQAVGGLAAVSQALDQVAFRVGTRRLSLLILIQILVALMVLYAAVRLTNRVAERLIDRSSGLDPTQKLLAQKLAAVAIIAVAFFIGIDLAGIDLTALAVFSGALGLAVGFGLQKTFGNLFAGIILLMDRSIKPGDVISVGDSFGSVSRIGVRAVSIVTRDGKEYLIPNEILMTEQVVNWSYSTRDVRISIPVRVAYGSDLDLVRRLMLEAAVSSARVLETPQPVVWTTAFGENGVEHEIRVWISDPEAGLGSVRSEILNRIWRAFGEHGIRIPFPQREVTMAAREDAARLPDGD